MDSTEITQRVETAKRKQRLHWHEEQIMKAVKNVADAFLQLRNDPLKPWQDTHKTFEDYCREVHGISSRRVRQITDAAELKKMLMDSNPELAPVIAAMPEGQMRELVATPVAKRVPVLKTAIRMVGSAPMTAKALSKARTIRKARAVVIDAATGKPDAAPEKVCPMCHRPL